MNSNTNMLDIAKSVNCVKFIVIIFKVRCLRRLRPFAIIL